MPHRNRQFASRDLWHFETRGDHIIKVGSRKEQRLDLLELASRWIYVSFAALHLELDPPPCFNNNNLVVQYHIFRVILYIICHLYTIFPKPWRCLGQKIDMHKNISDWNWLWFSSLNYLILFIAHNWKVCSRPIHRRTATRTTRCSYRHHLPTTTKSTNWCA